MSYEGYREYICANGHYGACNAYDEIAGVCGDCGAAWAYQHSVDQTNGIVKGNPSTRPATKRKIGVDDNWQKDRHGNRYSRDVPRYKPTSREWNAVK